MTDENEEPTHRLVMPFVATESNGGTLDDHAFVAGFTCGMINAQLHATREAHVIHMHWVNPELLPQLDLIALHRRMTMTEVGRTDDDEWVEVEFTNARIDVPDTLEEAG